MGALPRSQSVGLVMSPKELVSVSVVCFPAESVNDAVNLPVLVMESTGTSLPSRSCSAKVTSFRVDPARTSALSLPGHAGTIPGVMWRFDLDFACEFAPSSAINAKRHTPTHGPLSPILPFDVPSSRKLRLLPVSHEYVSGTPETSVFSFFASFFRSTIFPSGPWIAARSPSAVAVAKPSTS